MAKSNQKYPKMAKKWLEISNQNNYETLAKPCTKTHLGWQKTLNRLIIPASSKIFGGNTPIPQKTTHFYRTYS